MKIIQWNTRGIKNKRQDLIFTPFFQEANILVLQETWLNPYDIFTLPNRNIFRIDREDRRGGGLLIAIRKDLSAFQVFSQINADIEILIIKVQIQSFLISLFNIYIPPGNFNPANLSKITTYLDENSLILGDFNASHEIWGSSKSNASGNNIFNWIITNDLILLNNKCPTYLHSSGTLTAIDLSLTSINLGNNLTWSTNIDNFNSDHFPIVIHFDNLIKRNSNTVFKRTNWTKFNYLLQHKLLSSSTDNINIFEEIKTAQFSAQQCMQKLNTSRAPWWTSTCSLLRAKKRRLLKKARKHFNEKDWIKYKEISAKLKRTINNNKEGFWLKTCEKITNSKDLYKIIKILQNRSYSDNSSFNIIEHNNVNITDEQTQANCFLQFYTNLNFANLQTIHINDNNNIINDLFSLEELNISISHQKNSSPGHDKISIQTITHLPSKGIELLLNSFNDSWKTGIIPTDWTHSIILPLLKPNKNPKEVSSYRPISLTSVIAKLIERMILHRMLDYSFKNKIFHINHHGFYPHRSSINSIIQIHHDILLARKQKKYFVLIALDIKAAYDSVWPSGLISKLDKIGFSGRILRWIQSFLHQRTIQIKWRNHLSISSKNNYGVPQGCILSPFLFMIYMSDIFELPLNSKILVYADDIFLYNSGPDYIETKDQLQESLNKILIWCENWKLTISPDKSKLINFSNKRNNQHFQIKIENQIIPEVSHIKILGIFFDSNITWKKHVNYLRQKGFKSLNAIKALSSPKLGTRSHHLLPIINATIRSKFDYGCQVYSFASSSTRDKLEPIYNAALRLALGLPRNTPTEILRAESGNSSIRNRHDFNCDKFIIKQLSLKTWSPTAILFWNVHEVFFNCNIKEVSIFQKSLRLLQELCIYKSDILQWIPPPPLYESPKFEIYTHGLPFQNKDLPNTIIKNMFLDYSVTNFHNSTLIATDGSKTNNQTSIGIFIPKKGVRQNFLLRDHVSIFTAEAIAIWTALQNWATEADNYVILTDSLSVLKSLQNINRKSNTVILNLISTIHEILQLALSITFIWIPAHKGIDINEEADKIAKATPDPWNIISWIPIEDLHAYLKRQRKNKDEEEWKNSRRFSNFNYLSHIKNWNSQYASNRSTEVLINKMRSKKLPLNDLLFLFKQVDSPMCSECKVPETSEHFILTCTKFRNQRRPLKQFISEQNEWNYSSIANCKTKEQIQKLEDFLKSTNRFIFR